jgi:GntR family transcriptional regulator, transcriptional repressor for pyruvate dehydrogenase complex
VVLKSTFVMERVPRQRLSHVIADQVLEQIRSDNLAPGTRLPSEHELMRMLHVGRSTVREALNGLALTGAIEIRHGQGCFVASTAERQPRELEHALRRGLSGALMEARFLVEVEMLGLAAERATNEDLGRAEQALTAYERALKSGQSTVRLASRLHLRLLEGAHNDVLFGFIRAYLPMVHERGLELEEEGPRDEWEEYREHAELFGAVRDHDIERARARMREHLGAMSDQITKVEQG